MTQSRSVEHFQRLYDSNQDPWKFGSSTYEQAKYANTLATLGDRRFTSGLEVGCSIGILTRMLAARCDTMLGLDIVEQPLLDARARCADLPGVQFQQIRIPDAWPDRSFDLIVFSEVLYFLTPADIDHCARRVAASLLPNPAVLLVNWLGKSDDPCTGDEAADRFITASGNILQVERTDRQAGYRLDFLTSV